MRAVHIAHVQVHTLIAARCANSISVRAFPEKFRRIVGERRASEKPLAKVAPFRFILPFARISLAPLLLLLFSATASDTQLISLKKTVFALKAAATAIEGERAAPRVYVYLADALFRPARSFCFAFCRVRLCCNCIRSE